MRISKFLKTAKPYLTDGGLETYMVFAKGLELPCFSSHVLLDTQDGQKTLKAYLQQFLNLAVEQKRGYVLGTETWRLNDGWSKGLCLSKEELIQKNKAAVEFAKSIRKANETSDTPIVINAVIGPAGDGYRADQILSPEESYDLHISQIHTLGNEGADLVTAMTLTHASEAVGMVNTAREIDLPIVLAFTVETDGNLPTGQSLKDAINEVDTATASYPLFYMINCAHPDHFRNAVAKGEEWTKRIGGIRANASRMSHEELDNSEELDAGNPEELGELYSGLVKFLPNIKVVGGCCGTDYRHVNCIANHV